MKINRRFTQTGTDVFESIDWTTRTSKIMNPDGSVVFEMNDAEVPASWSQLATDIMVSKYFRKAGVPQPTRGADPIKAQAEGNIQMSGDGQPITGPERSVRQVVHRLAGCWRSWGEDHGYFDSADDAQAFYDELAYMMLTQMAAPNSPQWFNTGLAWAYGINGPAQGHYYVDSATGEVRESEDAYTHPQPHACFIQSVNDDLVAGGGIMDLWTREARLFKYGSGTGTNFSNIRGENEPLSGGGKSSGLMSFLKIGDRAAGAIKSGGTTRRAAKMVCLDMDHPDIEDFTTWKVREELKVAALAEGIKHLDEDKKATAADLGLQLNYDFNGEAYQTVAGQNSNNSIRIPHAFFHAVEKDEDWTLVRRTDGQVARSLRARELWDKIGYAAWRCADPGVQYDGTINDWHTCPEAGRINASNPCSEYMFLDNTACNLASLNLLRFFDAESLAFDLEGFEHAAHLWTMVLEISVLMAQFPSKEIAELSYRFRTLGLGYANLGAMLMQAGIPYDSERGRAICGCVSSILTGQSYASSAEMAGELGAFPGYAANQSAGDNMLRVIRNHRRAAHGVPREQVGGASHELGDYEGLGINPVPIDGAKLTDDVESYGKLSNSEALLDHARRCWDRAMELGERHGYRNAQSTVVAPTGPIGLLMDCDTTGVEPDFALVKFKKLAGGGYFKIANQSLPPALRSLGYDEGQVKDILTHVLGTLTLNVTLPGSDLSFAEFLRDKGLSDQDLANIEELLPSLFELSFAFNAWTLGAEAIDRLGLTAESKEPGFNLLSRLGLSKLQVKQLSSVICGTQTIEGAPHLKDEHLAVFDCANTCGPTGKRFIAATGHIQMMAAAQPFISGAISKTINLPNSASVDDIKGAYQLSWELGLKANALYRDGCKLSQPLNTKADEDDEPDDEDAVAAAKSEVTDEVLQAATEAGADREELGAMREPVERIVERIVERPLRRRLPDTRRSLTHKFNVAGHEGYLNVGLYEDGTPGELFITMAKEGSTIGGLMDSLGTAISVALQYGVPVDSLVHKFTHQRFEPAGMTHNREIPFAKSLVDYIFRWMGMEFVPGYREANAPQRPSVEADTKAERPVMKSRANVETEASSELADATITRNLAGSGGNGKDHEGSIEGEPRREAWGFGAGRLDVTPDADAAEPTQTEAVSGSAKTQSTLTEAMKEMQSDAPACDVCGTITVRNGTCYKCMNCGNSMGCS